MLETSIAIDTADGVMEVFHVAPDGAGRFPPVILYMDVWGIRPELFDIARRISREGYSVLVPDLYYRQGKIRFEHRDAAGRMVSIDRLDETTRNNILKVMRHLTDDMVVADTKALLRWTATAPAIGGTPAGAIGYCMGGRHALVVAACEDIRATACLHGSNLVTEQPTSPHFGASRIRGEIYFGFAEKDRFATPDVVAKIEAAFARQPAVYAANVHKGAEHGYALPDRDIYDQAAAERDWDAIFAMFGRQLRG